MALRLGMGRRNQPQKVQSEHVSNGDTMRFRPKRLCLAIALALGSQNALAQTAPIPSSDVTGQSQEISEADVSPEQQDGAAYTLDSITVTGTAEEEKKAIGNTAGASKEDVERRKASHVTDLLDQISGVSANNLYSAPETSVKVQGIAGHGRVSQSLEGVTQNFHAFTKDIGQTGSIFVDPGLLSSIDVTRGVSTSTGTLGSLGGAVDFKYMDLDDILLPGKSFGGMIRGQTGFSKYRNGEKPSGSFFLGGRNERWDVMVGASDSSNDAYRVGSSFDKGDMLRNFHANNLEFRDNANTYLHQRTGECRYLGIRGLAGGSRDGFSNCQLTPEKLDWLKQAAESGELKGTQRNADAQMLRVRHFFNDAYDQSLELFATANHAKYETDQQPIIYIPEADGRSVMPGTENGAVWGGWPWSVGAELDSQVVSLKYKGAFSDLINPEIQLFHESQDRKQRWVAQPGSVAAGENMHYFVENKSFGLKLANASYFDTGALGPLRLNAGVEIARRNKKVDSLGEDEWYGRHIWETLGIKYNGQKWDPDSRADTTGFSLALSTAGDGPWQASAGIGWQHVSMDVYDLRYEVGNVKKAGTQYSRGYWRDVFLAQGYDRATAIAMGREKEEEAMAEFGGGTRLTDIHDEKKKFNLKQANFALQYTKPGTGLTTYASIGYSERAPTSNEMYINGAWMRQGLTPNPNLEPEKNLALNLGVNYQRKAWLMDRDSLSVGLGYYRNRIRNYIGYGPNLRANESTSPSQAASYGYVASVNNLEPVIRSGFELNLAYQQPLFYVRANVTVPLRHDNKMCSWQSPSGNGYHRTTDNKGNVIYTDIGKGQRLCYSGWNWMETSLIEPISGSLTAALTPYQGRLELGGTLHYRGKQRASYWYVANNHSPGINHPSNTSSSSIPDGDGWLTANLYPSVMKVDLFVNYRFNDNLRVGVYVANLTDKMDATPTSLGYNFYPGRTITANMEYRF
ncbi:TonB-dependent receptor [Salmonella enterica subsp. enterica serovar Minnesota]|nr:TonB-dependent receptor [Salmonella enterica subsp. enterica serovar Minnesota]EDY8730842.1 TonB-dependent receptor [Salmonella enterica]HDN7360682.1 TonB-dependent receptor [Salmonella enterica subsp. enterica serovar Agona]